jgi:hypothetical protein
MLGKCEDCGRIRNTRLPNGWDPDWLNGGPLCGVGVSWRCAECTVKAASLRETQTGRPHSTEIVIDVRYLMPLRHVVPFLGSIAFIIMMCLIVAHHW